MDPIPALVASGVSLVLLVLAVRLRGLTGRRMAGAVVIALTPPVAVLVTLYVSGQSVTLPPQQFRDWVLLAGVVAIPVGVLASRSAGGGAVAALLLAAIAAVLFRVPTESLHNRDWGGRVALHVSVLALAVVVPFGARVAAAAVGRSTEMLLATAIAMLAAAPALGFSGTGTSALLVAALSGTAGLFGLLLVARIGLRDTGASLDVAAAAPQSMLFGGLVATGVLYAETPMTAGVLLIAAPLVALVPGGGAGGRKGVGAAVVRLVVVVAIVAGAVWLCRGEPDPYSGY